MKPDALTDMLEILTAGGRLNPEKSNALPQRQYGDPSKFTKMKGECMQGTKEIEGILRHEIENWMRWGRKRDWMPTGFRCPLGMMYKSLDRDDVEQPGQFIRCDEIGAAQFERIVIALPERHRQAFVMHHLEKAAVNGWIMIQVGRNDAARILGVQLRQYHYLVNQSHGMVLRECLKLNPDLDDDED